MVLFVALHRHATSFYLLFLFHRCVFLPLLVRFFLLMDYWRASFYFRYVVSLFLTCGNTVFHHSIIFFYFLGFIYIFLVSCMCTFFIIHSRYFLFWACRVLFLTYEYTIYILVLAFWRRLKLCDREGTKERGAGRFVLGPLLGDPSVMLSSGPCRP